jgi:hypothetical protein
MGKLEADSADSDTQLTKLDVVLTFQLEVSHNKDLKSVSQEWINICGNIKYYVELK